MRSRTFLRCVPTLLVAGPTFAFPNEGPPVTPVAETPAARREAPRPSASFVEAAWLRPQDEAAAAPEEPAAPPPPTQTKKEPKLHVFAFYESREFDELTVDPDFGDGGDMEFDINDTEQTRAGLGMAFGKRSVKGYFEFFSDELTVKDSSDSFDFEGFGGGGGVAGSPAIAEINADTHLTLPYRFDVSLAFDTSDLSGPGEADLDLLYIQNRLEVGVGVEWMGLHPSLGIQATSIIGYVSDDISDPDESSDATITGFNPGFYAGVAYKHPEFPMFIDLRFFGGDVSGWTGVLGASF